MMLLLQLRLPSSLQANFTITLHVHCPEHNLWGNCVQMSSALWRKVRCDLKFGCKTIRIPWCKCKNISDLNALVFAPNCDNYYLTSRKDYENIQAYDISCLYVELRIYKVLNGDSSCKTDRYTYSLACPPASDFIQVNQETKCVICQIKSFVSKFAFFNLGCI